MGQDFSNNDKTSGNPLLQPLESRFFEYLLELEVRKATRYLYYFSLIVVQMDPLKAGDDPAMDTAVDGTLGEIMQDEIRGTDLLGKRTDGSFFIILHYTDLENAVNVGKRMCERVEHYTFEGRGGNFQRTVSVGVSCFPTNANAVSGLVQRAEDHLKIAQAKGGNAVSVAS